MSDIQPTPETQRTDLATTLHDLADKLADFAGELPSHLSLTFAFTTYDGQHVGAVDTLATALIGQTGQTVEASSGNWRHEARKKLPGMQVWVYTHTPPPAEEDPAVLRARIAELEAENTRLNEQGGGRDA